MRRKLLIGVVLTIMALLSRKLTQRYDPAERARQRRVLFRHMMTGQMDGALALDLRNSLTAQLEIREGVNGRHVLVLSNYVDDQAQSLVLETEGRSVTRSVERFVRQIERHRRLSQPDIDSLLRAANHQGELIIGTASTVGALGR